MGMFGKLLGSALDIVTSPLDLVEDVVDIGDNKGSKFTRKLKKAKLKLDEAADDVSEGDLF